MLAERQICGPLGLYQQFSLRSERRTLRENTVSFP